MQLPKMGTCGERNMATSTRSAILHTMQQPKLYRRHGMCLLLYLLGNGTHNSLQTIMTRKKADNGAILRSGNVTLLLRQHGPRRSNALGQK
jgi:hypothetical protein